MNLVFTSTSIRAATKRRRSKPGRRRAASRPFSRGVKKGNNVLFTRRIVLCADGETRTITTGGTDFEWREGRRQSGLRQAVAELPNLEAGGQGHPPVES
jgi:hypothetical protein